MVAIYPRAAAQITEPYVFGTSPSKALSALIDVLSKSALSSLDASERRHWGRLKKCMMLDLLSSSIRPDGDIAAKTTPAATRTVAHKPNKSVVVFNVVKVFTLSLSFAFTSFFIFFIFGVLYLSSSRDNPSLDAEVAAFVDEASEPLQPKVAVYFAVATGLPFSSASSFSRSALVFALYK